MWVDVGGGIFAQIATWPCSDLSQNPTRYVGGGGWLERQLPLYIEGGAGQSASPLYRGEAGKSASPLYRRDAGKSASPLYSGEAG